MAVTEAQVREMAEAWDREFSTKGSVRLPASVRKTLLMLLGALAFTAIGVWFVVDADSIAGGVSWATPGLVLGAGVASIVFFGLVIVPTTIWRSMTGRPIVTVTPDALNVDKVRVPWADVAQVHEVTVSGNALLVLRMRDEEALMNAVDVTLMGRLMRPLNSKSTGGPDYMVPTGLKANRVALAHWLTMVHARQREG